MILKIGLGIKKYNIIVYCTFSLNNVKKEEQIEISHPSPINDSYSSVMPTIPKE